MRPAVLLVTHRRDHFTVDRVADGITRRGGAPVRLDTDDFPVSVGLDAAIDGIASDSTLVIDGIALDPARVAGVWCRRLWSPPPPPGLDEQMALACVRETRAALNVWLAGFEGRARFVNPSAAEHAAECKGRQLAAARAVGLAVPPTLVTNRPEAARVFWQAHGGAVVAKMLTPYAIGMQREAGVYTSPVSADDLEHLDGLAQCPMVFQARVDKAHELRAIVVGERVFAGRIDAGGTAGATDWRRAGPGEVAWRVGEVDDALAAKLCAVVRRLGLVYGAVDIIIRPDGTPVFLEVNPGGEWGMLEHDLGLPIGDAIAAALMGGVS